MNKKFIIWQSVFLILIGTFYYLKWYVPLTIFVVFELLILYGRFRRKEKNQYCLPAGLAKGLKKIPLETQYESSILGTFLILIGLISSGIYSVFFMAMDWWFKGLIIFNILSAIILLGSQMATTYQQYNSYKETKELMNTIQSESFVTKEEMNARL
jgi:membrane protein implicated in regulation of membrane protease activity